MNDLSVLQIIALLTVILTANYKSTFVHFNSIIWLIMAIYPTPNILHTAHCIGAFQIITGWVWFPCELIDLYIKLLSVVWICNLIYKDCLVNKSIANMNETYEIGFENWHIMIGIPLICSLAYWRKIRNFNCFDNKFV
jgi:hypothetical protein